MISRGVYKAGTGRTIERGDRVALHFGAARTVEEARSGSYFESTFESASPVIASVGEETLIGGLEDALIGARVGSALLITVSAAQTYGPQGLPERLPGADHFVLEVFIQDATPGEVENSFGAWFSRVALEEPHRDAGDGGDTAQATLKPAPSAEDIAAFQKEFSRVSLQLAELRRDIDAGVEQRKQIRNAPPLIQEQLSVCRDLAVRAVLLEKLLLQITVADGSAALDAVAADVRELDEDYSTMRGAR